MIERPATEPLPPAPHDSGARRPARHGNRIGGLVAGIVAIALLVGLALAASGLGQQPSAAWTFEPGSAPPGSSAAVDLARYLLPTPRPAPPISLENAESQPLTLAGYRGSNVLVFFGYTHCPDVCPATIGIIGETMRAFGPGVAGLFVTIDPERDTPAWLRQYDQYVPTGLSVATGTAAEIRATADAWGVKYARVDTGNADAYAMSHTADVFLVDAAGMLRADFPFGTDSPAIIAVLRQVASSPLTAAGATPSGPASGGPGATTAATPASSSGPAVPPGAPPASVATTTTGQALRVDVVSTSVWAGSQTPVILSISDDAGQLGKDSPTVMVQLSTTSGGGVGAAVTPVAVRPPGEDSTFYVATLAIPSPGWWRLAVTATLPTGARSGTADVAALDPGSTATIGEPAPTAHTPTLGDVGGDPLAVTTDPDPDLRLSRTSTTDALAQHTPFVLVIDSTRFRVTSACGKAIVMARYLIDRWPGVDFIHLEPFRYSVVTDSAVLDGTLADPPLNDPATAWGIGGQPWGAASMPWVFVVDGAGTVRAKYQGVMGSDDVDVMLSLIAAGG